MTMEEKWRKGSGCDVCRLPCHRSRRNERSHARGCRVAAGVPRRGGRRRVRHSSFAPPPRGLAVAMFVFSVPKKLKKL